MRLTNKDLGLLVMANAAFTISAHPNPDDVDGVLLFLWIALFIVLMLFGED